MRRWYFLMINLSFNMKIFITFLLVVWLLPEKIFAQNSKSNESAFVKRVEAILVNSCLIKKNFGIKIYSLERNKTLYSVDSNHLFSPASNIKLLTTATALKRLRPNYRFKTGLYATMPLHRKNLRGDIYIKGFGDPNLVSEQMWLLVNKLKNLPLHKIHGDIIADESFFDGKLRIKTWKKKLVLKHITLHRQLYRSILILLLFMLHLGKTWGIGLP
jgi:serine-type D-Ala-D-Ala carboxypeptidase/endopeptidase (penicillin-binding protein 4)